MQNSPTEISTDTSKHIPMVAAGVIFGIVCIVAAFFALQWVASSATKTYQVLSDRVLVHEQLRRTLSMVRVGDTRLFENLHDIKKFEDQVVYLEQLQDQLKAELNAPELEEQARQKIQTYLNEYDAAWSQVNDLTHEIGIGHETGYRASLAASGKVLERYARSRQIKESEINIVRMRAQENSAGDGFAGDPVEQTELSYLAVQEELLALEQHAIIETLKSYIRTYLALVRTDEVVSMQRSAMYAAIDNAIEVIDEEVIAAQLNASDARTVLEKNQQLIGFLFVAVILGVLVATIYAFSTLMKQMKAAHIANTQQKLMIVEAKNRAEDALKSRSAFLATISHEIRTPMNGVLGMAQLLKRTQLDHDQHERLDRLMRSGKTMMGLLNDLLDLSKIEAGKLDLEPVSINVREMLYDLESIFGAVANEKDVHLNLVIDEHLPARVMGDEVRIRQIVTNLLSNAIKFTKQGAVTLSASDNEAFAVAKGHVALSLVVQDSGIGMTDEALEKIFDPFSQAEQSTTRKFGGTGLGLAIVKELIHMMGGEVEVFSKVGEGSTFVVILPLPISHVEPEAANDLVDGQLESHTHSLNILVAEDNTTNAQLITWMLEDWGHKVHVADNGKLAIDALEQDNYDLILMDHHMPEMDGMEATRRIRSMAGPKGSIPIIGCTADAYADNKAALIEVGQNDIVTKPIEEKQLHLVLLKCIRGEFKRSA